MARTLVVLRHAKSSWDDRRLADHDRPLADRGRRALPRLRWYLADRALPIELVLCSTALRARQTLDGVRDALDGGGAPDGEAPDGEASDGGESDGGGDVVHGMPTVRFEDELYLASAEQFAQRLEQVDDAVSGVLLVGHNPGIEDLLWMLAGAGDAAALEQLGRKVPTGALAELTLPGSWSRLRADRCHLDALVVPRALPG